MKYQWKSSTTGNAGTFTDALGISTNASYRVSNVTTSDLWYQCEVSESNGICPALTSDSVNIKIKTAPSITVHPSTTEQIREQGKAFSVLTVTATGSEPLTYQWYSNTTNSTTGGTPVGTNANTYTPASTIPVNKIFDTLYYYCIITNTCGSDTTTMSGMHIVSCCDFSESSRNITHITSASFATPQEWMVRMNSNTVQVWSDAVIATECHSRTEFDGGTSSVPNVDCRNASNGFNGDYFSWCAVMKYPDILCPGDWRVPTVDDFENLDIALGGTGANNHTFAANSYMGISGTGAVCKNGGGTWGGSRLTAHADLLTNDFSNYWSFSQRSTGTANALNLSITKANPKQSSFKFNGFALRCVKELTCSAPKVSTHPKTADVTRDLGFSIISLTVKANGSSPLTYQWYSNTTNSTTGGTPVGTNASFYTPSNTETSSLYYYCVVTNACGSDTSKVSGLHTILYYNCNFFDPKRDITTITSASFATNQTWFIPTNNDSLQVWSDAVVSAQCDKTTFDIGISSAPVMDCRNAINGFNGHYFSWCSVMRYKDILCPAPWRVPTVNDFVVLDKALGGTGASRAGSPSDFGYCPTAGTGSSCQNSESAVNGATGSIWGGAKWTASIASSISTATLQTKQSNYWSSTSLSTQLAVILNFNGGPDYIHPNTNNDKITGNALRCVKDARCEGATKVTVHPSINAPTKEKGSAFSALSVTVTSNIPITYQWYSNTINSNTGGTPVGANSASYTPSSEEVSALYYYCVATNACGSDTSNVSGLHVVLGRNCDFVTPARNITDITSASFATLQEWTVGSQTWSDAVIAAECHSRTAFNGGSIYSPNVDCRNATNGFNGDYFTWCAVMKYADVLCPGEWRVPTTEDFATLHVALGGTLPTAGSTQIFNTATLGYCPTNGGGAYCVNSSSATGGSSGSKWGGSRFTASAANLTHATSFYWSSSELSPEVAYLMLYLSTSSSPQASYDKGNGLALRCVKDITCTTPAIDADPETTEQKKEHGTAFTALSVKVTGSEPLTYQWYSNTVNSNTGGTPVGANTASYTPICKIPENKVYDTMYYYCIVTNPCGSVTSNVSGRHIVTCCNFTTESQNLVNITSATFATEDTWVIGEQTWSDAVVSTQCNKSTFNGGPTSYPNVDCRNATNGFNGDYFTWCAVMKYADVLCPAPWRVPTKDDFIALDKALGGTGANSQSLVANRYTGTTGSGTACINGGGTWGGSQFTAHGTTNTGLTSTTSNYWSFTQSSSSLMAYYLRYNSSVVNPQNTNNKSEALALRCVK